MPFALAARSIVLGAYFVALVGHGLADVLAQITALTIVVLWAGALLLDRHHRGAGHLSLGSLTPMSFPNRSVPEERK